MHDPMCVAFEVKVPIPKRARWRDAREGQKRWTLERWRRTNPENLGEPVYPWYQPKGWKLRIAGRAYEMRGVVTVWHNEPGGSDSGEVCKHWRTRKGERVPDKRWKLHVHHWTLQVHLLRAIRRFLFERCIECGHRFPWGYAPVSHSWDGPKVHWFRVQKVAYHHQCSSLGHLRQSNAELKEIIRGLSSEIIFHTGEDEADFVERAHQRDGWSFHQAYSLQGVLGYERDEQHRLRKAKPKATR